MSRHFSSLPNVPYACFFFILHLRMTTLLITQSSPVSSLFISP
jgi:hypothetical protein